jgi:hypothetical protein
MQVLIRAILRLATQLRPLRKIELREDLQAGNIHLTKQHCNSTSLVLL